MKMILSLAVGAFAAASFRSAAAAQRSDSNFDLFDAVKNTASASGGTRYLHLEGDIRITDLDSALKELEQTFAAPLQQKPPRVLYSDVIQVAGAGHVRLNLVVEPIGAANAAELDAYVARLEAQGYHGLRVAFQPVSRIDLSASLQFGMYDPNTDEAFDLHYEVPRSFSFPSIAAWLKAYDGMGSRIIAAHDDFTRFIGDFVGDPARVRDIQDRVLPKNNMVEFVTLTSLAVGGLTAGPYVDTGPMLPFNYIRYCLSSRWENGMCSGTGTGAPRAATPSSIRMPLPAGPDVRWN